jgi:PhnB protein
MDSAAKPHATGYRASATPYLCAMDTAAAIQFYEEAFGAEEKVRLMDGARISHAEVKIGEASIFISDEFPEIGVLSPDSTGGSPVMIVLDVGDADEMFAHAVAAGAKVARPMSDGFGGAMRNGKLVDPFGHRWMLTTWTKK